MIDLFEPEPEPEPEIPAWIANEIGPLTVGCKYKSGYWHRVDTVISIDIGDASRISYAPWSITVVGDDGWERTHCTPWSYGRGRTRFGADQIVE